jgi:septum formation protein
MTRVVLPQVYLASASPRRAELLQQIGVRFEPIGVDVQERAQPDEPIRDLVPRLARAKAEAGWTQLPASRRRPVLGADTAIGLDDDILGKPRDRDDAIAMLLRLSGRVHEVYSAVALVGEGGRTALRTQISEVRFRRLTRRECEAYWDTGEPCDKAGSYAIQGLGAIFIEQLRGSYSGVMGLPLFETACLLEDFGIAMLSEQ